MVVFAPGFGARGARSRAECTPREQSNVGEARVRSPNVVRDWRPPPGSTPTVVSLAAFWLYVLSGKSQEDVWLALIGTILVVAVAAIVSKEKKS